MEYTAMQVNNIVIEKHRMDKKALVAIIILIGVALIATAYL